MSLKAKSEDEPALHLQSHVYKEKDKAKLKRKDDKAYRAPPKQLLGEIHTNIIVLIPRLHLIRSRPTPPVSPSSRVCFTCSRQYTFQRTCLKVHHDC